MSDLYYDPDTQDDREIDSSGGGMTTLAIPADVWPLIGDEPTLLAAMEGAWQPAMCPNCGQSR